jgi:hypothetical protein
MTGVNITFGLRKPRKEEISSTSVKRYMPQDSVQDTMSCEPSYADLDVRLRPAVKAKELDDLLIRGVEGFSPGQDELRAKLR